MNKSYGFFEIKEVNEEKRTFKGIASTPNQDRSKDIMVPKGAKFTLPMPLLFHHNPKSPVGHVTAAQVSDKGIEVEIHIPKIEEEGDLQREIEKAYQSLKYNLVKGLSVGFLVDWSQVELLKDGGIQFNEWEWVELSLVTIPDNPDSQTDFKKAYEDHKAASGINPPKPTVGVTTKTHQTVQLNNPTKGGVKL